MKMRTKLFISFGVLLLLMFALASIGLNRMMTIDRSLDDLYTHQYEKVKLSSDLRGEINTLTKAIANLLLSEDNNGLTKSLNVMDSSSDKLQKLMDRFANEYADEVEHQIAFSIVTNSQKYISYKDDIRDLLINGNLEEAKNLRMTKGAELQAELLASINNMTAFQENAMNTALQDAKLTNAQTVRYTGILTLVGLIIGGGVMIWILISLTSGLNMVAGMITDVEKNGNKKANRVNIDTNDEFGDLARIFNRMTSELEEIAESERLLSESSKEQALLKSNLVQITTLLQGQLNLFTFAESFIGEVCRMTGSIYGAFYVKEEQKSHKFLKLYANYARSGSAELAVTETLDLGEGLPGQSLLDKKPILLNDIPPGYANSSSAFGQIDPLSLLVQPIYYEEEVVAIFEISSLNPFTKISLELCEQLSDSIGSMLNNIRGRMKVEELLRISQELTEELQSQSEELLAQQNELQCSHDMLARQAAELSIASNYKSEFLANMSHELRTPLNSLLILSQLLADNKEGNLSSKQVEYAETVHSSGQELLKLINDVLDLSKVESGKFDIEMELVVIEEVKRAVRRTFQAIAENKKLDFYIESSEDVPESIRTDYQRLLQIIKNLLSNAFKFTSNGKISLHISRHQNDPSMVAFSVIDTGIGIPTDKQEMIFEAFRQADGTTNRKYGGTGLGLSISREFAHLLGGEIHLESVEGEGSRFTLLLPEHCENIQALARKEAAAAGEFLMNYELDHQLLTRENMVPEGTAELEGKKVLLVDDDMRNLYSISNLLESFGIQVVHAVHGIQAIEMLMNEPTVDLVVMDVMMPEMDGYEAIYHIRKLTQFADIPIIALTAKAMREDKEKCISAGASDYLTKPVQADQLLAIINVWLCNK
jgi:two-component system chemotaxis sensor kinase CheA